jgi:hypothetical protein
MTQKMLMTGLSPTPPIWASALKDMVLIPPSAAARPVMSEVMLLCQGDGQFVQLYRHQREQIYGHKALDGI